MDETLQRLEDLLETISSPESQDPDIMGRLPAEWDAAVACLVEESSARKGRNDNADYKARLQQIMDRMPAVMETLAQHRSEVSKQLSAENRRMVALRSTRHGYQGSRLLHRKV
ncbi:MAG: hypothetical protein HQL53_13825 [Magnetococcales bacterium]|nr:hypothetical protein [Magnetococcales bacterium]